MSTAVVVNSHPRRAASQAEILRAAGHVVELCAGPQHEPCPVLGNLACPLVDRADVLVYDAWVCGSTAAARELVADLRDTYPDLPVVLTSVDGSFDWIETDGPHRVTALIGEPTPQALQSAVETALLDQGMAV